MKLDFEVLETRTYLVHYRAEVPTEVSSLEAALEQVRDKRANEIQRTPIEDGDAVSGIEYAYFAGQVTWYGALIKTDGETTCIVEIELGALTDEIAARLKELEAGGRYVTDIRMGQLQAQSLSECRQRVAARQMTALSDAELSKVTEQLGATYTDAISSSVEPFSGRIEVLHE